MGFFKFYAILDFGVFDDFDDFSCFLMFFDVFGDLVIWCKKRIKEDIHSVLIGRGTVM